VKNMLIEDGIQEKSTAGWQKAFLGLALRFWLMR
jgi:hypothetical protein